MRDLGEYINKRKKRDKRFAAGYDEGYEQVKVGVMLWQAREAAGLTQGKPIPLNIKVSFHGSGPPGQEYHHLCYSKNLAILSGLSRGKI